MPPSRANLFPATSGPNGKPCTVALNISLPLRGIARIPGRSTGTKGCALIYLTALLDFSTRAGKIENAKNFPFSQPFFIPASPFNFPTEAVSD